jgi:hypothetical protein
MTLRARALPPSLEHEVAHEAGHPAQVVRLADVQDVVAGKPVECAAIPVFPEQLGLLGRRQPVSEAGDDQPPVLGHQRGIVQW